MGYPKVLTFLHTDFEDIIQLNILLIWERNRTLGVFKIYVHVNNLILTLLFLIIKGK